MILDVIRAEDQIAGRCPRCHQLFRLSEVEIFYIPDREGDFLMELRNKERELNQRICEIREDAIKRSRSSILGLVSENLRPYLSGFEYNPRDLRSIWNPIDYVSFNGLALNRCVESITFIEIKTGNSSLSGVERSIRDAVAKGKVHFKIVKS